MSVPNCCFLTCIQISQEAGKVVWYSHLFKNFPQFVVTHTVKGFTVVNEAEVDIFLEFSCFFYDPTDVDNFISDSSACSNSSLNIWNFWFMHCWSLVWRIFSMTLPACEMSAIVLVWKLFGIAYLWTWNENLPFPELWPQEFSKFAGMLSVKLYSRILNISVTKISTLVGFIL